MVEPKVVDLNRRRRRRRWACGLALTLLLTLLIFHRPLFLGNLGVVAQEQVYRSAQPTSGLERLIREHKLGSILNLRGGSSDDPWYANEVSLTDRLGVEFYDFPMSAVRRPSRRELLVLLDLFDRCRYPLLIHCKSGADRTGLATGLYLMEKKGVGPSEALRSFSVSYGHIPLFGPEHLHEPLREYAEWLDAQKLAHSPERFRHWVTHLYASKDPRDTFRPLKPGPRMTVARQADSSKAAR